MSTPMFTLTAVGDPINMRDPSGMCGWVLVDPEYYGGTWHYNECPDDVGVTGQRDGRISEDDFHWFQEHTHWDDGWDDWWDGTSAGIMSAYNAVENGLEEFLNDCDQNSLDVANDMRQVGHAFQGGAGIFGVVAAGAGIATLATAGTSAPISGTTAVVTGYAAGGFATIGTALDLFGSVGQAYAIRSTRPITDLGKDYFSSQVVGKFGGIVFDTYSHVTNAQQIGQPAKGVYSCEG